MFIYDTINTLLAIIFIVNFALLLPLLRSVRSNVQTFVYVVNIVTILLWILTMMGYRSGGMFFENWLRALYVAAIFIGVTYMQFTFFYPIRIQFAKYFLYIINTIAFGTAYLVTLTDKIIVEGVITPYGEPRIVFGSWYMLYILIILVPFLAGFSRHIYIIIKHKSKVLYLLVGYMISANIAFVTNLLLPWFGIFVLNWVGQFFTIVMVSFTTYSILKFNLMNIRFFAINVGVTLLSIVTFSQVLFADSLRSRLVSIFVFFVSAVTGYFLMVLSKNERKSFEHTMLLNKKIKKINKQLEEANIHLQTLNKMKTEFVSFASHEIRTPVTIMKGYADLLVTAEDKDISEENRTLAKKILISGNDVLALISQYLNKSKMELGQMQYNFSVFDVVSLVKEAVPNFILHAEQRGLTLTYHPVNEEMYVNGDSGKLKEVIGNLIDNSLKYTPSGSVDVFVSKNKNKVLIAIKDTGVGIAKETISGLFQEFGRADTKKVNILGTGLGLYLARIFVEAHKGKVWAESEGDGKGAQFYIELPEAVKKNEETV